MDELETIQEQLKETTEIMRALLDRFDEIDAKLEMLIPDVNRIQDMMHVHADKIYQKSEFVADMLGDKLDTLLYKADIPVYYLRNIQHYLEMREDSDRPN